MILLYFFNPRSSFYECGALPSGRWPAPQLQTLVSRKHLVSKVAISQSERTNKHRRGQKRGYEGCCARKDCGKQVLNVLAARRSAGLLVSPQGAASSSGRHKSCSIQGKLALQLDCLQQGCFGQANGKLRFQMMFVNGSQTTQLFK